MKINSSRLSLLMVVYINDNSNYFEKSLDSILEQTLLPDELILIQNGPVKKDIELIIEKKINLGQLIIKKILLPKNVGLGIALREGLKHCSYEFVARMDPDDICYNNRFEKQIDYLEKHPEIDVCGSNVQEFIDEIDYIASKVIPSSEKEILKYSKFRNPLNHPTVIFRKSKIIQFGSYENMPLFEDYFLWLKVINKGGKIYNIPEKLVKFRLDSNLISRRRGLKYAQKEYNFLKTCYLRDYFSFYYFLANLLIKIPLRVIPTFLFNQVYKKFHKKEIKALFL